MLPCLITSYLLSTNTSIIIWKYDMCNDASHFWWKKTFHHLLLYGILYSKWRWSHVHSKELLQLFEIGINSFIIIKKGKHFAPTARAIRCCLSITTFWTIVAFLLAQYYWNHIGVTVLVLGRWDIAFIGDVSHVWLNKKLIYSRI